MSAEAVAPWQVVGRSVRGASHLRDGLPNHVAVAHRTIVVGAIHEMVGMDIGHVNIHI